MRTRACQVLATDRGRPRGIVGREARTPGVQREEALHGAGCTAGPKLLHSKHRPEICWDTVEAAAGNDKLLRPRRDARSVQQ